MKIIAVFFILATITSCNNSEIPGTVVRFDSSLNNIVSKDAKTEIIAKKFKWSEGSLWLEKQNMLLFSDVPANTIYKWTAEKGKEIYLAPSGYTGEKKAGVKEGSNGLLLDNEGNLVLCQHGDRRMAKMNAPLDKPEAKFITLADKYNGKRFSSPNDAVYNSEGELFFTDPPYGLESQGDKAPVKEIPFNGVYKLKKDGTVILLVDSILRPNGIALFPDGKKLIISCSDLLKPNWYIYDINGDSLTNGRIFNSVLGYDKSLNGSPDGLKIDKNGNVFATGPGGVYIFNSEGKKLGLLKLNNASSNCALSADEKTLYITNHMYVLKFKMRD